jgi:hypothetical protein
MCPPVGDNALEPEPPSLTFPTIRLPVNAIARPWRIASLFRCLEDSSGLLDDFNIGLKIGKFKLPPSTLTSPTIGLPGDDFVLGLVLGGLVALTLCTAFVSDALKAAHCANTLTLRASMSSLTIGTTAFDTEVLR